VRSRAVILSLSWGNPNTPLRWATAFPSSVFQTSSHIGPTELQYHSVLYKFCRWHRIVKCHNLSCPIYGLFFVTSISNRSTGLKFLQRNYETRQVAYIFKVNCSNIFLIFLNIHRFWSGPSQFRFLGHKEGKVYENYSPGPKQNYTPKITTYSKIWAEIHSSSPTRMYAQRQDLLVTWFTVVSCLVFSWPWRWRRHIHPKRQLAFSGLHSVISQKIELFILVVFHTSILLGNLIKCV
jgi:hypothetical protein